MKIPKISPKILNFVLIIAVIDGIVLTQLFYDGWKMAFARKPNVSENVMIEPHPLPANVLKKASMGLNNLIADILWIQAIQYYGGGDPSGKYRKLPELMDTLTDLDPKFVYPYAFGLLIMPGEGFAKEAVALGEKGMKNPALKTSWEIPYYLGLTEHFNLKNHTKAAEYLKIAADRPGSPEITKLMAGIYYAKANERTTAYNLYVVVYQTSKNKYVKERAKAYLDHMQLIFAMEKIATQYKEKNGNFPTTLEQLVSGGFLKEIPADPLERGFVIDSKTGIISDAVGAK